MYSGLAFAAALLSRDKTILFSGMYALAILIGDWRPPSRLSRQDIVSRIRNAAVFSAFAFGPPLAYRVWLIFWLHATGIPSNAAVAPLSGALGGEASGALILESIFIFIPAGICAWLAVQALIRGERAIALPTFLLVTFFSLVTLNQVFFSGLHRALSGFDGGGLRGAVLHPLL